MTVSPNEKGPWVLQLGSHLFFLRGHLGGGFKYVLFSPLFGEDSNFD